MIHRTLLGHKLNARAPFKGIHKFAPYEAPAGVKVLSKQDLRHFDNRILDQGSEGDCVAAASGGAWMYLQLLSWRVAHQGYNQTQLEAQKRAQSDVSMDFIYALALMRDGNFGEDAGSFGSTGAYVLSNFGACYASVQPNTGMGYKTQPSPTAMAEALKHKVYTFQISTFEKLKICLSDGYPAWIGVPVFRSWVQNSSAMDTGIIPDPHSWEQPVGGHEMKVVGFDDSARKLLISNSWGPYVGNGGYFVMSYNYYEDYAAETFTARLLHQTTPTAPEMKFVF
jgi:hypothetical protein